LLNEHTERGEGVPIESPRVYRLFVKGVACISWSEVEGYANAPTKWGIGVRILHRLLCFSFVRFIFVWFEDEKFSFWLMEQVEELPSFWSYFDNSGPEPRNILLSIFLVFSFGEYIPIVCVGHAYDIT